MKEYRIVESHGWYEPQFRFLFFWMNFETLAENIISFNSLENAEKFIKKSIALDDKKTVVKEY